MDVDADLEFFLFVVAGGVVLRVLGQASLRLIEQERDLPHQDELIWGANWLWLLIPSLVAAGWLLVQLAHRLRYYELTTIMIGRLLFPVAVALLLWYKPRAVVGLILMVCDDPSPPALELSPCAMAPRTRRATLASALDERHPSRCRCLGCSRDRTSHLVVHPAA